VRDNIRFAKPEATDEEICGVLDRMGLESLLRELPNGLDTEVGEKGASLSLGQRQLVCFARALLPDPTLIVLDEATSSVDAVTELRLQRALSVLLEGRTSFVVAHRLSTIRHADLILVVDAGRLVERGSHHELLARNGHYTRLFRDYAGAAPLVDAPTPAP
jgi:ATP-binding cassette subfamily B protein